MPDELSAVEIPPEIVNNKHADYVSWTAFDKNGKEYGEWNATACFAHIMRNPGRYEIHCRPYWQRKFGTYCYRTNQIKNSEEAKAEDEKKRDEAVSLLPGNLYKQFWKYCKEVGLVPPEVKVFVKNGQNRLLIPRKGWDRHTVYIALSLWRHCDCHPRIPAMAILLYRKLKKRGVHFLQCLHYAMADYGSPNPGHVFITINDQTTYQSNYGAFNLAAGLALAHFCRMPLEERKKLQPESQTNAMFCNLAKDLNPILNRKSSGYYSANPANGVGYPEYRFKSKESLLLPKFGPLFDRTDLTPKAFAEAIKEECE
jgi:hypothetical protein